MYADSAEQTVRILLNGVEVTLRIAGNTVVNLMEILRTIRPEGRETSPGDPVTRLFESREDLHVLSMQREDFRVFRTRTDEDLPYLPFVNRKRSDGIVDVVLPERCVPRAEQILRDIRETARTRDVKKNSLSFRRSGRTEPERESVLLRLEQNRREARAAKVPARPERDFRSAVPETPER